MTFVGMGNKVNFLCRLGGHHSLYHHAACSTMQHGVQSAGNTHQIVMMQQRSYLNNIQPAWPAPTITMQ